MRVNRVTGTQRFLFVDLDKYEASPRAKSRQYAVVTATATVDYWRQRIDDEVAKLEAQPRGLVRDARLADMVAGAYRPGRVLICEEWV